MKSTSLIVDQTYIKHAFNAGDLEAACKLLSYKCRRKPCMFAANVAQFCGYLAQQNRVNDIIKLMNYLRENKDSFRT